MQVFIRGFFSFFMVLIGIGAIGSCVSNIQSCTTYGKMDGSEVTGDCKLPRLEEKGALFATTEKGVTTTTCILYVRKSNWHAIKYPTANSISDYFNCAIDGYGYVGNISNKDVVVEESFWKSKTKNEDVCVVGLTKNEWILLKTGSVKPSTNKRNHTPGGKRGYTVISNDNSYLDDARIYHSKLSIEIPPGFTRETLRSLLRKIYFELEENARSFSGDDIGVNLSIEAYLKTDNPEKTLWPMATPMATIKTNEPLPWVTTDVSASKEPIITFDEPFIERIVNGSQIIFGLTEDKRKETLAAFTRERLDILLASDDDSLNSRSEYYKKQYGNIYGALGTNLETPDMRAHARALKLREEKVEEDLRRLYKKYNLTEQQISAIEKEAVVLHWDIKR